MVSTYQCKHFILQLLIVSCFILFRSSNAQNLVGFTLETDSFDDNATITASTNPEYHTVTFYLHQLIGQYDEQPFFDDKITGPPPSKFKLDWNRLQPCVGGGNFSLVLMNTDMDAMIHLTDFDFQISDEDRSLSRFNISVWFPRAGTWVAGIWFCYTIYSREGHKKILDAQAYTNLNITFGPKPWILEADKPEVGEEYQVVKSIPAEHDYLRNLSYYSDPISFSSSLFRDNTTSPEAVFVDFSTRSNSSHLPHFHMRVGVCTQFSFFFETLLNTTYKNGTINSQGFELTKLKNYLGYAGLVVMVQNEWPYQLVQSFSIDFGVADGKVLQEYCTSHLPTVPDVFEPAIFSFVTGEKKKVPSTFSPNKQDGYYSVFVKVLTVEDNFVFAKFRVFVNPEPGVEWAQYVIITFCVGAGISFIASLVFGTLMSIKARKPLQKMPEYRMALELLNEVMK